MTKPQHPYQVWGLWDAGELLSVHSSEEAARDAYEGHLFDIKTFGTDDPDAALDAIEVIRLRGDSA